MNTKRTLYTGIVSVALTIGMTVNAQEAQDAPEVEEKPKWESSASLGVTLTDGNSDTLLMTADVVGAKKWELNELSLGLSGAYGENEGDTTNESLEGFGQYNRLFPNERTYGFLRVDALYDAIADIDYRLTLAPGLGHYFIKDDKTTLSGEVGPGYVFEKLGGMTDEYLTLRVGERFTYKINDRSRVYQSLEWLPQVDDFDNWVLNGEIGFEADITEQAALTVIFSDTYRNQPATGRKHNDLRLVAGVRYKFQ